MLAGNIYFGGILSAISLAVFTWGFEFNWVTVEIVTLLITNGFLIAAIVWEQLYHEDSEYDKAIAKEIREKEKELEKLKLQKTEERRESLNRFKDSVATFKTLESYQNVFVVLKKFETLILRLIDDKKLDQKERYYLESTLPKDLVNTLAIFYELTPQNQKEMSEKIFETLQKKYDEMEYHFVHKKQENMKTAINKQMELLKVREY